MFIYQGEEIKRIDQTAADKGFDTFTLMENAGRALFEAIVKNISKQQRLLILSGKGNNGGDGVVLARYLKQNGYKCELAFPLGEPVSEYAVRHYHYYLYCGFEVSEIIGKYDVVIDALLGVGARLPLRDNIEPWIEWVNEQQALRIAIDIPTGVLADSGEADKAIRADQTYTLHGYKPSAFLESSAEYYGRTEVVDIGLPQSSKWRLWTKKDVIESFPKRNAASHKGTFGSGLLIAGTNEMPGSAMLASLAAMRSGIGKLTVATTKFASGIIASRVPECTFIHDGLEKVAAGEIPKGMKGVAIGPGLDNEDKIDQALEGIFKSDLPIIIDAGALKERKYPIREAMTIVTPHPGEFSKMTGIPTKDIQKNRLCLATEYATLNNVTVVLKGRNTVIAYPDGDVWVNVTGNDGLAKGGTGDTLTGMILAFVSFYEDKKAAVANAVYCHGASADYWSVTKAKGSLLASDVSENLAHILKEFE